MQRTFETGPKQWASFFTSYAGLVYLQMYLKGKKHAARKRSQLF